MVRATNTSFCQNACSAITLRMGWSRCDSVLSVSSSGNLWIGIGRELNGTIFLSMWKMPLMNFLINDVPRRTENAKLLTVLVTKHMRLSPIWRCNELGPTTSILYMVALFGRGMSQTRIKGSQPRSAMSSFSRLAWAPVSMTKLIELIRDAVMAELMSTCNYFLWTRWQFLYRFVCRSLFTVPWNFLCYQLVSCLSEFVHRLSP